MAAKRIVLLSSCVVTFLSTDAFSPPIVIPAGASNLRSRYKIAPATGVQMVVPSRESLELVAAQ